MTWLEGPVIRLPLGGPCIQKCTVTLQWFVVRRDRDFWRPVRVFHVIKETV